MTNNYFKWILQRPFFVSGLALLLIMLITLGSTKLTFRSDDRVFFSSANPELLALENFESRYGREDSIIFVVTALQDDLFTVDHLQAINQLTENSWQMPHVKRVDSVTNFQRVSAQGDEVVIDHLARAGDELTQQQAIELKQAALQEPLLTGRLLTWDARVGLVVVQFRLNDDMQGDKAAELMQIARTMAQTFRQQHTGLDLHLSGSLALDNAFGEASSQDGMFLTPLMFTLIVAMIAIIFRNTAVVFVSLLVITGAIGCAMGMAGLLNIPLSSPSVSAPFIILTLATADCIHLAAALFRHSQQQPGLEKSQLIAQALKSTFRPITMTSLTTAVGFFSLTFSESPPFAHLGIIAGMGVLFAWLLTLSLFPAMLNLLPWKAEKQTRLIPPHWWQTLHGFIEQRAGLILIVILTTGVVAGGLAFKNNLDDRYVEYFDVSFDFRTHTDYLNQKLGGFYNLEYSIDAGEADGIAKVDYLQQLDAFADWLRQQPGVTHVASISDIMRMIHRAMNGGDVENYRLPNNRIQASQYLLLYEMSLPMGLNLREQITTDKSQSRMTVSLQDLSTQEVLSLVERAEHWVKLNAPALQKSATATGTTVLFSHIGQRNIEQMLVGTFMALFLISLVLFILFKSLILGCVAIITNLIPPLAALGGWAILVGEVGMAVATIAAVTLGIVVDDTIHFLEAAQRARRSGADTSEAVLQALQFSGPGIAATSIILAAGFACLAFSGFQINAWTGLMTAVVICVALIFDFLFLPSVLIKVRSWK